MPSVPVSAILEGYEAWGRGDPSPQAQVAPDFELHPPPDLPGESVYRGPGANEAFMRAIHEAFESIRISPLEVLERWPYLIIRVRLDAVGRHSGVEVAREEFHVYHFDGPRLKSFRAFPDEADALAYAGGADRSVDA